jgi:endoribonuclease L-PSP, putative
MKKPIVTKSAPEAIGPYSQGIISGNLVFASGQIPLDPATGALAEGIEDQAARAFENLKGVLSAAGASLESVLKTTIFIKDIADFPKVNAVYSSYFKPPYPARSTVGVSALPKGALVEIEAVAEIGGRIEKI